MENFEEYGVVTDKAKAAILQEGGSIEEVGEDTNLVTFPVGTVFEGKDIRLPSGAILGYDGSIDTVCSENEARQEPLYLKKNVAVHALTKR